MANPEHVARLSSFADHAHGWEARVRRELDLSGANLQAIQLQGVELFDCDLSGANLSQADLRNSVIEGCKFEGAVLRETLMARAWLHTSRFVGADLTKAQLYDSMVQHCDFSQATMVEAHFNRTTCRACEFDGANLSGASLISVALPLASMKNSRWEGASLRGTILAGTDLSGAIGLDEALVYGAVVVDQETIKKSGRLPRKVLQSFGLLDEVISVFDAIPGAIHFHSCFISYSDKDRYFAERLHADLQMHGVRCWFAPEDLKIGDRHRDAIDEAIHVQDRLLVVLSEASIASSWVEAEVETALDREHRQGRSAVLFPIRIDDAILTANKAWAGHITRTRNIGDFSDWTNPIPYDKALRKLLRDLRPSSP